MGESWGGHLGLGFALTCAVELSVGRWLWQWELRQVRARGSVCDLGPEPWKSTSGGSMSRQKGDSELSLDGPWHSNRGQAVPGRET